MNVSSRLTGYLVMLSAVLIWGGWIVLTRYAVLNKVAPDALSIMRFSVPAILLAPVLFRIGLWPKGKTIPFLICLFGLGTPYFYLLTHGTAYAPAADVGPLTPGTMPLLVALLSAIVLKEKFGTARAIGFALCAAGVVAIGGRSILVSASDVSFGHMLLLATAFAWASYTVAFRFVGVTAIEITALISFWSTLISVPLGWQPLVEAFQTVPLNQMLMHFFMQGFASGLVAIVFFSIGISRLGASRAAAFVALVPACATVIAIPVLHEIPDAASIFGVVTTGLGVLLASGVVTELLSKKPVE